MLWLSEKTICLTQGDNHSMTCYYTHSKNLKFCTCKKILYYNRIKYPLLLSHNTTPNTQPNTCSSIMNISLVTLYYTSIFSGFHAITMFEWWKYVVVIWFVNMSEKLAVSSLQQQKWQHNQSPHLQHQNMGQWRKSEASIYLNGSVSECRQRQCVMYTDYDCSQSLYCTDRLLASKLWLFSQPHNIFS